MARPRMERDLKHRSDEKRRRMERIKARDPQPREIARAELPLADRCAIEPEKDEAGERKEEIDGGPALVIEGLEQPIERLGAPLPPSLIDAVERKEVLPVPEDHAERGQSAQCVQRMKAFHGFFR